MKIGMLDSGSGCLSVLHEAYHTLPTETEYVIYADLDHVPYGTKTREEIVKLTGRGISLLEKQGVDAVVIACNTATGAAVKQMRQEFSFPIIGMEPAIKPALESVLGESLPYISYARACEQEKLKEQENRKKQEKQEEQENRKKQEKQEEQENQKKLSLPEKSVKQQEAESRKNRKEQENREDRAQEPAGTLPCVLEPAGPLPRVLAAATPLALQAEKFHKLVERYDAGHLVDSIPLPGLVTFAEREDFNEERVAAYIMEVMEANHYRKEDYGALVLGCTHFNYFKPIYRKLFGNEIQLVDGRHGTIRHLANLIGMEYREEEVPLSFHSVEELHEKYHTEFFISGRPTTPEQDEHWLRMLQRLEAIRHI